MNAKSSMLLSALLAWFLAALPASGEPVAMFAGRFEYRVSTMLPGWRLERKDAADDRTGHTYLNGAYLVALETTFAASQDGARAAMKRLKRRMGIPGASMPEVGDEAIYWSNEGGGCVILGRAANAVFQVSGPSYDMARAFALAIVAAVGPPASLP